MNEQGTTSRRHVVLGFGALFLFVVLGAALETFHAFKTPLYLDVGNETRRLMWRLAHAHGTLLSLVNVVYGLCVTRFPEVDGKRTSQCFALALVLVPFGFFAGGINAKGGDPGAGIVLVPVGFAALVVALGATFLALKRGR